MIISRYLRKLQVKKSSDMTERKNLNRIKVVLAERNRTSKWLGEQINKDASTVSKWVTNTCQPPLEILIKIAKALDVTIDELVRPLE